MTIEQSIKDIVEQKLSEGIVEKIIADNLEKGVHKAIEDIFGSWGDGTKTLKKNIESVIIPYLDKYDYSDYVTKLDGVLAEVLKSTALDHKKMLTNFKDLMSTDDVPETIKVGDLFEKWTKYVAENVSTDDLDICFDDGPSYESVEVTFDVDYSADKDWSSFENAILNFECEHDSEMNFSIRIQRWKSDRKEGWDIRYEKAADIKSLRYLGEFDMYLMRLTQKGTKLIIDEDSGNDDIYPEKEPEPTFS